MQRITVQIRAAAQTIDLTPHATAITWDYGPHGCRALIMTVPRWLVDAYALYSLRGEAEVIARRGAGVRWRGVLDSASLAIGQDGTEVVIRAIGGWQALRRGRHTALWSTTDVGLWRATLTSDIATRNAEIWQIDTNNRLFIGLKKGTAYPSSVPVGSLAYIAPDGAARSASGAQFRIDYNLPAGWSFAVTTFRDGFTSSAVQFSVTPGAGAGSRAYHLTFAERPIIEIYTRNLTGATYTNGAEDGAYYVRVTDLRVVGDTTDRVNTTLTANVSAGSSVSCTVGSTAGMYVGMDLVLDSGNANSEIATVTSITDATHVVVDTLANAHASGQAVQGHQVLASTVVAALHAEALALNAGSLAGDTSQIAASTLDITDLIAEDALPADVIDGLATRGDGAGGLIETGVDDTGRLYFRPRGAAGRRWYARLDALTIDRDRSSIANRIYATYSGDGALRTGATDDATSQADYGVRVEVVAARTSQAAIAEAMRDLALIDQADPTPSGSYTIAQVETEAGAIVPGDEIRPGDTIMIRNLPPAIGLRDARLRSFVVGECGYNPVEARAEATPETPPPLLDVLIAQGMLPG